MSDFLSINPVAETVEIRGKKVPVPGISAEGFGNLIPRFPNLVTDLQERLKRDGSLSIVAIIEVAGPAMGPILAAGLGLPGNEEAEKRAAQLDMSSQLRLMQKIIDRTMPDGLGPFVDLWAQLMAKFAPQKPRFKILQRQSKPSSDGVTPVPMSG